MPETYNDESCVAELHTRSVIAEAVQGGWQLAKHGCIPATPRAACAPSTSGCVYTVMKVGSANHVWECGKRTVCRIVKCGTVDTPAKGMIFKKIEEMPDDIKLCKLCARKYG